MAKGSGTTRSVGSSSAASGRTFTGVSSISDYNKVGEHFNAMRDSLTQFAEQNGWRRTGAFSAIKTLSDTDNIRTVAIRVEEDNSNGTVRQYYRTEIIENLTPAYESKDHDRFQSALRFINGAQFETLREADSALKEWARQMNKMKIR